MGWSLVQQRRLQVERQALAEKFPRFQWINPTDPNNTKVEGYLRINSKMFYKIRLYVPSDFPNSRPDMVVISPYPLTGYEGKVLKVMDYSMHILSPRDGYVKICHYHDWVPNLTLYAVVIKGRLWLEALESHKQTGLPIDHFLRHAK
jgi:ubiquitin-protein ligase